MGNAFLPMFGERVENLFAHFWEMLPCGTIPPNHSPTQEPGMQEEPKSNCGKYNRERSLPVAFGENAFDESLVLDRRADFEMQFVA